VNKEKKGVCLGNIARVKYQAPRGAQDWEEENSCCPALGGIGRLVERKQDRSHRKQRGTWGRRVSELRRELNQREAINTPRDLGGGRADIASWKGSVTERPKKKEQPKHSGKENAFNEEGGAVSVGTYVGRKSAGERRETGRSVPACSGGKGLRNKRLGLRGTRPKDPRSAYVGDLYGIKTRTKTRLRPTPRPGKHLNAVRRKNPPKYP